MLVYEARENTNGDELHKTVHEPHTDFHAISKHIVTPHAPALMHAMVTMPVAALK